MKARISTSKFKHQISDLRNLRHPRFIRSHSFVFVVAASSAVGRVRPVASCVEASPYATRRRSAVATTLVNQHPRHLRHPRSTSSEEIVLIRVHWWLVIRVIRCLPAVAGNSRLIRRAFWIGEDTRLACLFSVFRRNDLLFTRESHQSTRIKKKSFD